VGTDITRLDNAAPYRKGGHRETWQRGTILQGWTLRDLFQCSSTCSWQVYVWFREYYMSCLSVLCLFLVLSVLLIATCDRLSWPALWTMSGYNIKKELIVWLTDRSISKSFICPHCVLCTVYVFYVRIAPVRLSWHVAPRCTLCNSHPRLLPRLPLPIPSPLMLALLAQVPACSRLRPRCCCRRPAAVGTPYERRQNGWLHAETAGDYKRLCLILTNRI